MRGLVSTAGEKKLIQTADRNILHRGSDTYQVVRPRPSVLSIVSVPLAADAAERPARHAPDAPGPRV
jgi:hypothetical protein